MYIVLLLLLYINDAFKTLNLHQPSLISSISYGNSYVIYSSVKTERTEINTSRSLIGLIIYQPKKNRGLHEIIKMM